MRFPFDIFHNMIVKSENPFHNLIVVSADPDTKYYPSPENTTLITLPKLL